MKTWKHCIVMAVIILFGFLACPSPDPEISDSELVEMVWIPGGSFDMGNEDNPDEQPVHTVSISGFYMGKYEITQAQYKEVMGSNPSWHTIENGENPAQGEVADRRPVDNVNWYTAIQFCNELSQIEGLTPYYTINKTTGSDPNNKCDKDWMKWLVTINDGANGYRLPTEAEWEYAARGGDGSPGNYTYAGSNDLDEVAWYEINNASNTHEVGKKPPNGLGLYDMSGNVWELCWDWYGSYEDEDQTNPAGPLSGSIRIIRGGGRAEPVGTMHLTFRDKLEPIYTFINQGFRVVRSQ